VRGTVIDLCRSATSRGLIDPEESFSAGYMDYATPISEPILKRFIARHRLEKKDPKAA